MSRIARWAAVAVAVVLMPPTSIGWAQSADAPLAEHPLNTWVKQSPLPDAPPSPRLGYEGACVWDSKHDVMIRYGGHNQGGGGEQGAEIWTFDPITARWELKEPNISPPGICCGQQNVFDPISGRYIRFPAFSGSHGWQWHRELYLNDSTVWMYDLATNAWRNMRPLPVPHIAPLRCASWDVRAQVVVVFGGEGSREGTLTYNPYTNEWTRKNPPEEPGFRSGGNMAYDAARDVHVLFGAQFSDDSHTWIYDLKENRWRDAQPPSMPPTDRNDAVLTYDPINKIVLAVVRIQQGEGDTPTERLETWAYDTAANRWQKMNPEKEPDPTGSRARQLMFAPELNLALLENRTHRGHGGASEEQQVLTYRYGEQAAERSVAKRSSSQPRRRPPLVDDVVVSILAADQVRVIWRPPDVAEGRPAISGYQVERAVVDVYSEDQLVQLKSRTRPLEEPSVGAIARIGMFETVTPESFAESTYTDREVDLNMPQRVHGEPLYQRRFSDDSLDDGGKPYRFGVYAYRVRAVDAQGNVSGPSPAVLTIPSAPQWVFSREDDTVCQLKWAANPEQGVAGYRVYRLDGRWNSDAVPRLTDEPLEATVYTDAIAGEATRRYHIVAVDALGQEGFPSSPVWYRREWERFYRPFVGEWHQ